MYKFESLPVSAQEPGNFLFVPAIDSFLRLIQKCEVCIERCLIYNGFIIFLEIE